MQDLNYFGFAIPAWISFPLLYVVWVGLWLIIKRLQKRYAKEGIIIPYPIEAVNLSQEKAYEENVREYNKNIS